MMKLGLHIAEFSQIGSLARVWIPNLKYSTSGGRLHPTRRTLVPQTGRPDT
jgi:hypothetical protein